MATSKASNTKNKKFWDLVKKSGARMMDLKFVDMLGTWQHCSYPIDCVSDSAFELVSDVTLSDGSSAACRTWWRTAMSASAGLFGIANCVAIVLLLGNNHCVESGCSRCHPRDAAKTAAWSRPSVRAG